MTMTYNPLRDAPYDGRFKVGDVVTLYDDSRPRDFKRKSLSFSPMLGNQYTVTFVNRDGFVTLDGGTNGWWWRFVPFNEPKTKPIDWI